MGNARAASLKRDSTTHRAAPHFHSRDLLQCLLPAMFSNCAYMVASSCDAPNPVRSGRAPTTHSFFGFQPSFTSNPIKSLASCGSRLLNQLPARTELHLATISQGAYHPYKVLGAACHLPAINQVRSAALLLQFSPSA
jgi:hypothetical protein